MDERVEPSYETLLRTTAPDPLFGTDLAELIGDGARRFIGAVFDLKLIRRHPAFWFGIEASTYEVETVLGQILLPARLPSWPRELAKPDLTRISKAVEDFRSLTQGIRTYIEDREAVLAEFGWRWHWDRLTAVEDGKGESARMLERYVLELLTEHVPQFELTRTACREQVAPTMASLFGVNWLDTSSSGVLAQKLKDIYRARRRR